MSKVSYELLRKLDSERQSLVKELSNQGWIFESDYWESGHNGDPYDDVKFKSPCMNSFVSIGEYDWEKITKKELLEKEAISVATHWVTKLHGEWEEDYILTEIDDVIVKELKKAFLARKSCKFETSRLPSKNIQVKISPKIKDKIKDIQITVKIT